MSDISVIIPAYNRAGLIGETLRSLLNQTVPAKEIIVVDDGSTDGTAEAAEREFSVFREQFSGKSKIQNPTFKILRQQNAGPGAARNRGLAEATGEFIHFFDSDDIAALNKHEVQLRALIENGADIAYGPWVKGRFVNLTTEDTEDTEEKAVPRLASQAGAAFSKPSASELARDSENTTPIRSASGPAEALVAGRWTIDAGPRNFVPEGPVLQARGLPTEDLVKALLTNWSIVPHACLFRRSILEKAGGFPEDIWVGEDQLLFLRCLLEGAKVVHTPKTMVYYRLGNDLGKLTAAGAAKKRHARDWGRFLLKANREVASDEWRVTSKRKCLTTECTESTEGAQGNAQGACAGTAFSNPSASELARDSENTSLIRSADTPASLPATSHPLPATAPKALTTPSAWFGFRLRAYEAWRDLGRFFPDGEGEVKTELQGIWKRNPFSAFHFQFSGFVLRKLAGLKWRVVGYREGRAFRCMKFDSENSGSIAGKLPTSATKFL